MICLEGKFNTFSTELFVLIWSRRIGTCRKKVMGLLRLMGNKADVVKGLAKRCEYSQTVRS